MKYNPKPQLPKIERRANPEYKEEYEMPSEYQEQAKILVEMIESRDQFAKELPMLSPEDYRKAKPHFDELTAAVEDLEEKMAYEYERYQEEQRLEQELYELTWLQDSMSEELFIKVKHQRPYIFEKFEEYATEGMTDAEREEHYAIIARREAEELDDILSGKIHPEEYKNLYIKHRLPDEWTAELLVYILYIGFINDSFFEINYDALERLMEIRSDYCFHISDALPVRRRNIEEAILDVKKQLNSGWRFLLDYAEESLKISRFVPLQEGYTEYLDSSIEYLERCVFWKYVIIKHTQPEKLEEYTRIATEGFTPAEVEAFEKRAAECEEKDLRTLMESLEYERIAAERVKTRRAAPDYKKIEGPDLKDREKRSIAESQERRRNTKRETPPKKIEHDLTAIFLRYLRTFRAVTGDDYAPERYEDEQSLKDEELDKIFDDMKKLQDQLYIIIKHQTPHLFDEFHKIATENLTPFELQEFYDRIAHLEATRLDELLSGDT